MTYIVASIVVSIVVFFVVYDPIVNGVEIWREWKAVKGVPKRPWGFITRELLELVPHKSPSLHWQDFGYGVGWDKRVYGMAYRACLHEGCTAKLWGPTDEMLW